MARVLIVYHSLGGNTRAAAEAVAAGVGEAGAEPVLKPALEATPQDLLDCQALAAGTPDCFSYMAGGLKDFFDRAFYPTQGKVTGLPCGVFVTHGGGGRAVKSVQDLCAAFRLKPVTDPVLVLNRPDAAATAALQALGRALAQAAATR